MNRVERPIQPRRITPAGRHFFFGYYDRPPLPADGRLHLALEVPFIDRPNSAGEAATLGLIDIENGEWRALDSTEAWNWQMGCSARWLGPRFDETVLYNVRDGDRAVAEIRSVRTGRARRLPAAAFDVSADANLAVSLNFARIHRCRPGYGYPGIADPSAGSDAPDSDGLFAMRLDGGRGPAVPELIVSIAQCAANEPVESMKGAAHWFNHAMISPGARRVMFLHRWRVGKYWQTRLYACRADGSELTIVNPGPKVSHCDWRDDDTILAWCEWSGGSLAYRLHHLDTGAVEVVAPGLFDTDGHCHWRPVPFGEPRRWLVTDTYPGKERMRTLILYDSLRGARYDVARFLAPERFDGEIRCDLHPRWDLPGRLVTVDSLHEGYRGIYVLDAGEVVKNEKG